MPLSPWKRAAIGGCLLLALPAVFLLTDYWAALPLETTATFVGRNTCAQCHQRETELWNGSHHDKAMELATDETVLGDFNDVTFEHDGLVNRLFRDGQRFMVHTEGPDGNMQDFEIKYVFGFDPLQNYMVEFDRPPEMPADQIARLQVLRISWDTHGKRWFYLRPPDVADKLAPDDPLHWTGIMQRWQTMCADCHSTNLQPNYHVASGQYHTTFSEMNVSCEACHGPGSIHVDVATNKRFFWDRNHGLGLASLRGDSSQPQLESCAPCHSRRGVSQAGYVAGQKYHDFFQLENLHDATYYRDGQIKDEVYEFGSFLQSKMYHHGIRCSDCHDPHSLQLKHPGNQTCTSCHQHPAGKYDVPAHHFHAVGSAGAQCVNCHMPGRTYMDLDFRRDHSFRIPRPDLSVALGTPNACSGCHVQDRIDQLPESQRPQLTEYADWLNAAADGDQRIADLLAETDRWAADAADHWYRYNSSSDSPRSRPPHFAQTIDALRQGKPEGVQAAIAMTLREGAEAPAIVRATLLDDLTALGASEASETAAQLAADPSQDPQVRVAAIRAAALATPQRVRRRLMPLLSDPLSSVQRQAAQQLAQTDVYRSLTPHERAQVDLAMRGVKESLMTMSDRAGAHMQWAGLCESRGLFSEAIEAYQTAIRTEPTMAGPRTNLAGLYTELADRGDRQAAERAAQLRREELPLLRRDANLAPDIAVVQYRFGLALYLAGELQESLQRLQRAVQLQPDVDDYRQAMEALREHIERSADQ